MKETTVSEAKTQETPMVTIKYLYVICNDVKTIRTFYTELLGMKETSFKDDAKFGWVAYNAGGIDYMFFKWDSELPFQKDWNWQPGDGAGKAPGMSISICVPKDEYRATIERLAKAEVKAMTSEPTWRQQSYWGWTVKDPMGNTIEVFCELKDEEMPKDKEAPKWAAFK